MDRLTAFEFIAAQDGPQIVRLKRKDVPDVVLVEFALIAWVGVVLPVDLVLDFEARTDLVIEGVGLGHPYWNDERPSWTVAFDSATEARRIATIRAAAIREANRAALTVM